MHASHLQVDAAWLLVGGRGCASPDSGDACIAPTVDAGYGRESVQELACSRSILRQPSPTEIVMTRMNPIHPGEYSAELGACQCVLVPSECPPSKFPPRFLWLIRRYYFHSGSMPFSRRYLSAKTTT